jgi:hypothetical protein
VVVKTSTLWIIRVALIVQFLGVLAVPTLVAAGEAPRAMWMADWQRPESDGKRTIGLLSIRDGKLSFVEQVGQTDWELDLAAVKRVAVVNSGRSLSITSTAGAEYVLSIMEVDLTQASPKKALGIIERAMQTIAANGR